MDFGINKSTKAQYALSGHNFNLYLYVLKSDMEMNRN